MHIVTRRRACRSSQPCATAPFPLLDHGVQSNKFPLAPHVENFKACKYIVILNVNNEYGCPFLPFDEDRTHQGLSQKLWVSEWNYACFDKLSQERYMLWKTSRPMRCNIYDTSTRSYSAYSQSVKWSPCWGEEVKANLGTCTTHYILSLGN